MNTEPIPSQRTQFSQEYSGFQTTNYELDPGASEKDEKAQKTEKPQAKPLNSGPLTTVDATKPFVLPSPSSDYPKLALPQNARKFDSVYALIEAVGVFISNQAALTVQSMQAANNAELSNQQAAFQKELSEMSGNSSASTKSGIAKVFGYVTDAVMAVAGAALIATGVGAGLGAMLLMGSVMSLAAQSPAGQALTQDIAKGLEDLGVPAAVAGIVASLIITVAIIVLSGGTDAPEVVAGRAAETAGEAADATGAAAAASAEAAVATTKATSTCTEALSEVPGDASEAAQASLKTVDEAASTAAKSAQKASDDATTAKNAAEDSSKAASKAAKLKKDLPKNPSPADKQALEDANTAASKAANTAGETAQTALRSSEEALEDMSNARNAIQKAEEAMDKVADSDAVNMAKTTLKAASKAIERAESLAEKSAELAEKALARSSGNVAVIQTACMQLVHVVQTISLLADASAGVANAEAALKEANLAKDKAVFEEIGSMIQISQNYMKQFITNWQSQINDFSQSLSLATNTSSQPM